MKCRITEVTEKNYLDISEEFSEGGYIVMPGSGGLSGAFADYGFDVAARGSLSFNGNGHFRFSTTMKRVNNIKEGEADFVMDNEGSRSYMMSEKASVGPGVMRLLKPEDFDFDENSRVTREGWPNLRMYLFRACPISYFNRTMVRKEIPVLYAADQLSAVEALLQIIDASVIRAAEKRGDSSLILSDFEMGNIGSYVTKDLADGIETGKAWEEAREQEKKDDEWTRKALEDGTFSLTE